MNHQVTFCLVLLAGCGGSVPLAAKDAGHEHGGDQLDASVFDSGVPDSGAPDSGVPDGGDSRDASIGADAGVALTRYSAAADYSDSTAGDGVLIIVGGQIVFERYVPPTTAQTFHLLASGTKSFSCALYALGAESGMWNLDTLAATVITEWQGVPRKQDIRLKHLLSLSSGLEEGMRQPDGGPGYSATNVPNLDTFFLGIENSVARYDADQAAIYTPTTFQVIAAWLERRTSTDAVDYLQQAVFGPLGIAPDSSHPQSSKWTRDARGKPQMAGGAYATAQEWARYGQLMLQEGEWNGRQLLSRDRVRECITYRSPAYESYGLTWWLNRPNNNSVNAGIDRIPADGYGDVTQIATNAPTDMYMAAGTGKQRLYVIPSLDMVIVRFGRITGGAGPQFDDHQFFARLLGVP
jgi:CubicO group peptidase (beta-lactamase class C family)